MTSVVLLPSARADLQRAKRHYRDQRPGLDRELRDEVDRVLLIIAENPRIYSASY